MADHNGFVEPPIDPLADTNPSLTIRPVELNQPTLPGWRRTVGLFSLLAAAGLTIATTVVLLTPPPVVTVTSEPNISQQAAPTLEPTLETIAPTAGAEAAFIPNLAPTISAETISLILDVPPAPVNNTTSAFALERDTYNPFTIVPERPRSEVIQYDAVQGDTIYTIADRFGIQPESIAWSNSRSIVLVLRPGDVINIPPVDGVYVQVIGSKTIAEIAASYQVTDPNVVIDSEYNDLFGIAPDTILPSGTWLFIPGGKGEDITWNPGVTVESGTGARAGFVNSFAPGDPGSCGSVDNPGGGAAWANPLPGSSFVRGFSSFHTGIDLSAPTGTPIRAANSGVVIFAGWNSWGFGNLVVLAHGPFLTLYGHMSSIAVGCGQLVAAGTVVGGVGSTGNSSGPHLHFEIRNGNTSTDPLATIPNLGL